MTNQHTNKHFKRILIITPVNVLSNWYSEFSKWVLDSNLSRIDVFKFNECLNYADKIRMLKKWQEEGGCLLIGHQTFANLIMKKNENEPEDFTNLIDLVLLDPDMVVIDEGK